MGVTGIAAGPWLLLLLADLQAGAAVTTEARGGHAPVIPGEGPRASAAATLRPAAEARLRERALTLTLQYSPQILWRYPNPLDSNRPLVLHTASLGAEGRPGPRTHLGARGSFSAGEADYAVLPQLIGGQPGALPESLELLVVSGTVEGDVDLSPRWRLGTEVTYTHRRPLGVGEMAAGPMPPPDPGTDFVLSRQNAVEVVPNLAHRLTPVDTLLFETAVGWEKHSVGIELYRVEPRLGWERRLAAERLLSLFAGVAYTRDVGERQATGSEHDVSPVAEAMLEGLLWRERQRSLSGRFGLQLEYYVDPVLATAGPRGLMLAGVNAGLGQSWQVALETGFGTSLRGDPMPGTPDETFVTVALPVRHRASSHLMLEAGVRYTDRAPHFGADDFDFRQREVWLYLAATATTFPLPAFGPPSVTPRAAPRPAPESPGRGGEPGRPAPATAPTTTPAATPAAAPSSLPTPSVTP